MDERLRGELLAMDAEDLRVRQELEVSGELERYGYHPRMEDIHRQNAARLRAIVTEHGWPARSLVGEDGATAAWRILQHAIGEPELQRGYLPLLQEAAQRGEIPPSHPAYLLDRICFFEGRPQVYGTQYGFTDDGVPEVWTIEDRAHVNERRARVGLKPLTDADPPPEPHMSPAEAARRCREMDAWARAVGWRS